MDLLKVYYTQSFAIGLAILAIVYLNFRVICDKRQYSHVVFLFMMLSVAVNLAVEYSFYMFNGKPGPATGAALKASLMILFPLEPLPVALWVVYLYAVANGNARPTRAQLWLIALPGMINLAATILSASGGGFLFRIVEGNRYVRGPFYYLTPAMCYVYLFYYLRYAHRMRKAMLRREHVWSFMAMLPMGIAGFAQVLFTGIYVTWLAAAFSVLILYCGIVVNQANSDHLTGLANRRRFDNQLKAALEADGARTALILIDIDNFKCINDQHGHVMGDRALEAVGGALRHSARKRDLVARIGGDEFAMLAEVKESEDIERIAERARESLAALNQRAIFPFTIEASVGVGACDEREGLTTDAFLQMIDNRMYDEKRVNHRRVLGEARPGFSDWL
jgi:diguanylate cyclase (GGDEF)-like protein